MRCFRPRRAAALWKAVLTPWGPNLWRAAKKVTRANLGSGVATNRLSKSSHKDKPPGHQVSVIREATQKTQHRIPQHGHLRVPEDRRL